MRRWWGIPVGLAVLAASLVLAGTAGAAPYVVSVCKTPAGAGIGLSGWTAMRHYGHTRDYCRSGSYFGTYPPASTKAKSAGSYGGWRLDAPSGTTLTGFDAWKSGNATGGGSSSTYSWTAGIFVSSVARGGGHSPWACFSSSGGCVHGHPTRERGYPGTPLDPRNHLAVRGLKAHRLYVAAGCLGGGDSCPASSNPQTEVHVYRLDLIFDDPTPPSFTSPPAGGLVDSVDPVAGPQGILFRASDTGSGVGAALLVVDGRTVATSAVGHCTLPYVKPRPCATSTTGGVAFDTSRLRDGAHQVSLVVTDATGVNRAVYGPVRVVTRNAVPACQRGAGGGARLTASWGRRRRPTAHFRFGGHGPLFGRLLSATGAPIGGRSVFLMGRSLRRGAPALTLGSTVTRADGRFRFKIRGLRSRRLRFAFRALATDTTAACSRAAVQIVGAPVTIRANRGRVGSRGRVAFVGRLRGRPLPGRHRLLLALQARYGKRWVTVQNFRARRNGTYRTTYRFKGGRGRFRFRVLVPTDPTYPFGRGTSRAVRVRAG